MNARFWLVAALLVCGITGAVAEPARHVRLDTMSGPVHVYWPAGYDAARAGIVVYVHGYKTTVDRAWREHRLAEQFAASGLDAMFVVPEAPRDVTDPVRWPHLAPLLDTVREGTELELPPNRIVVVGHSGAHRTLSSWLAEGGMDSIVLVDALYGDKPQFRDWLVADPDRQLLDAAFLTRPWAESLHAELAETHVVDGFPAHGFDDAAREARVLYVRSQYGHMSLVVDGIAIPMLLQATRLPRLTASAVRRSRAAARGR